MLKRSELGNFKEVQLKVMAASINPFDWKLRNGELRVVTGFRFPRAMGSNFSGVAQCCRRVSDAVVSLNDAISLMTDVELRRRKIGNLLFNLAQPTLLCRRDKEGTGKPTTTIEDSASRSVGAII
jgi:hypothetical protein